MEHIAKSLHTLPLPSAEAGTVPDWIHVLPAGRFFGRDGRGPYALEDARAVIAASLDQAMPKGIPMDYEHQTENAPKNGQPAPASGWITALEAREDGVWAHVEWTERAAAFIRAGEYRYVSPVFFYDKKTGAIQAIESVALTNLPNLGGLKAIAKALAVGEDSSLTDSDSNDKEQDMNGIKERLGLAPTATDAEIGQAIAAVMAERDGLKAAVLEIGKAAQCKSTDLADVGKAVAALAASAQNPDPAKFVPIDLYNAAGRELAEMKAARAKAAAASLVDTARQAGKISPAMEAWARDYAGKDPEGFAAWSESAPDQRPGGDKATAAKATPPGDAGRLTEEEKAICRNCGISEEDYIKGKN